MKILLLTLLGAAGVKLLFPSVLSKLHTLFKDYMKYRDQVKEEEKKKKIEAAKQELENAAANGSLNDLIDASKKLGNTKK